MQSDSPIIGIISPPDWYDPTVDEFRELCTTPVRMHQAVVPRPGLNYEDLNDIASAEPDVALAAKLLGKAGAKAIGMTGTPFVWAGLSSRADILGRQAKITAAAGCDVVMAGSAIAEALGALGAKRIAVASPYYTQPWRDQTKLALTELGFEVLSIASADMLGDAQEIAKIADHEATSDMETVLRVLKSLRESAPDADAMVVAGAGVRMLNATMRFEAELDCPVISSDTALYYSLMSATGLRPKPDRLGRMETALQ